MGTLADMSEAALFLMENGEARGKKQDMKMERQESRNKK